MLLLRVSCFMVGLAVSIGGISVVHAATDCGAVTQISQIECESLLQLYQNTNGAQWNKNDGWNVTNTPCDWFGVSCENHGVTVIQLPRNNLTGTLPDFRGLPKLRKLELDSNQLTGTIPDFSGLPELRTLRLSTNQLTGVIPEFRRLPKLQKLLLSNNQLSGAIPAFSGLPKRLVLSGNKLCQSSNNNYSDWQQAQLNFASCRPPTAAFTLSSASGKAPLTVQLDATGSADADGAILQYDWTANGQRLSGKQASSTFKVPGEYRLVLTVTDDDGFSATTQQTVMATTDCQQVTGVSKRACESLLRLYHQTQGRHWKRRQGWNVSNTPCDWAGVSCDNSGVIALELSQNNLTGTLAEFGGLSKLQKLELSENKLMGVIPDFRGLPELQVLELSENKLMGTIPEFSGLAKLQTLSLSRNKLTGTIPDFSGLPKLQWLELDNNKLTGPIPELSGLLQVLDFSDNKLSGVIPDLSGLSQLETLVLSDNNKLCKHPKRQYAQWQTQLDGFAVCQPPTAAFTLSSPSGKVPLTVQLTATGSADADGAIVQYEWIANGQTLKGQQTSATLMVPGEYTVVLTVTDDDGLTATTPQTVTATTDCQQVTGVSEVECGSLLQLYQRANGADWTKNQGWNLSNTPCDWFGVSCDNNGVIKLELSQNNLSGTLVDFRGLSELQRLDLSDNQLSGTSPEFSGLPKLERLDFSHNQLTGVIPEFRGLSQLQVIDFSHNKLTGVIPDLSGLSQLGTLVLSDNQLCQHPGINYSQWQTQLDGFAVCRLPTAAFTLSSASGKVPFTVQLNATGSVDADGAIVQYEWMANGQRLSDKQASTTFRVPGEYTVVLTVTDDDGLTATTQHTVMATTDCQQVTGVSEVECESLLQLYQGTNGADWTRAQGWNLSNTPCDWAGVSCNKNSSVIALELSQNNLTGTLAEFGGLPELQRLELSDNQLSGTIPKFSGLPKLEVLDLSINQLTGVIPEFSGLSQLGTLVLSDNKKLCKHPKRHYSQWQAQLAAFAVCRPPTAAFTVSTSSGKAPFTVQLDATGSADADGAIVQYEWIANGQRLSDKQASTTFRVPGEYTVVLTVKDNDGFTATTRQTLMATTDCQQVTGVSESECESLLQLYQGTHGADWTRKNGWNLSNTPCDWAGVICGQNGVIALKLTQNNLTGTLAKFGGLPKLQRLELKNNQLTGTLPDFSGLPELQTLDLSDNQLTGTLADFRGLPKLQTLSLEGNHLTGAIPDFSGLPKLQTLSLSRNQLTGAIADFSGLPELRVLSLSHNQLTGAIPDFRGLPELQTLSLNWNQLSGEIPDFSGLSKLQTLEIENNQQLTGAMPDFSGLPKLEKLLLRNNKLTGTIPNFSGLPELQEVWLTNNQLTGAIPDFRGLPELQKLSLSENMLTGTIPDFSRLPELQAVWLHNNQLSGAMPDFKGLPQLQTLSLYNNKLSGAIPEFNGLPQLQTLSLSNNKLMGAVPDFSGLQLSSLLLSKNQLCQHPKINYSEWQTQQMKKLAVCTSPLAAFTMSSASGNAPLTIQLDASKSVDADGVIVQYDWTANGQTFGGQHTSATFTVPGQYTLILTVTDNDGFTATTQKTVTATINCQQVTGVSERECESLLQLYHSTLGAQWMRNQGWNLSKTPCEWAGVSCDKNGVTQLELAGSWQERNNLNGTLPNFGELPFLQRLDLSYNQLSGTIPDFSGLPKLQTLVLSYNQLSGTLPDFNTLTELQVLDLSHNQLTGTLVDLSGLPKLQTLSVGSNQLTGTIPDFSGLPKLRKLDLSYNQLSGTIPDFSGLPKLQQLFVNNNQLTGTLADFTGLPQLQTLWLDNNQLSGTMPEFRALPKLRYLFLRHNQLRGAIPDLSGLSQLSRLVLSGNPLCKRPDTHYFQWQAQLEGFAICRPPTAAFTLSSARGKAPFMVQLDATGSADLDGSIVQYNWTANGQTLKEQQTSATLTVPGHYTLTLTVTDNHGLTATTQKTVTATTNCKEVTGVSEVECESLLQLYQSTDGAHWTQNQGWNLSNTPCDWFGVSCDKAGVIALELSQNNLTGTLVDFRGLPNLQKLALFENKLTGTIPDFSGLPKLQTLYIYTNKLTGTIPDFSGLPKLEVLRLDVNQLTGAIPDFSGLPELQGLSLYSNKLTGAIPDFSGLPKLQQLRLDSNQLTDTIPDFSGLPKLQRLDIDNNQLTGAIPDFSGLPELRELELYSNKLTGVIPDFSGLPKLRKLELYSNKLTGAIPDFSGLPKLQTLSLYENKLTGTIPDFSGLPKLRKLELYSNKLRGVIPDFSGLPKLQTLVLSRNQLTGAIPNFSGLPKLQTLVLSNKKLCQHPKTDYSKWQAQLKKFVVCTPPTATFTLSSARGKAPLTVRLDASSSADYDGTIVQYEWTANGQTLVGQQTSATLTVPGEYTLVLTVTDNDGLTATKRKTVTATTNCKEVTGVSEQECESLLQLYQSTNGANWYSNYGWNITNRPCRWYGVICDRNGVIELKLAQNNLTGTLADFRGLPHLQKFWLYKNHLSGAIPDFGGLPELLGLYIYNNKLTGAIPDFSGLPKLLALELHRNQLTGALPDFSGLPKLHRLALSENQLTGTIPDFSGLSKLQKLWLYQNQLTGAIPDFSGLPKLRELSISRNQLTGTIPNFSALSKLQLLRLDSNQLTGAVPDFSGLPELQRLDIDNNKLTGVIPDFTGLPKLHTLWLSSNKLTGTIPDFNRLPKLHKLVLSENKLCKRPKTNYSKWQAQLKGFGICPTAAFTVSSASGKAPLTVQLDAGGSADLDGAIVQYDWTANGQTLVGQKTSTTFTAPGQYSLVLTVKDNDGFTATKRKTVTATTNCKEVTEVSEVECELLLQLYQSTNGANWTRNKGWNVSNTPCRWYGVTCDKAGVIKLDLSQNNLTGSIADIVDIASIANFIGLPESDLQMLLLYNTLSENRQIGAFSELSGLLPKLRELYLSRNKLTGAIPDFSALPQLQTLVLSGNQLCKHPKTNYSQWQAQQMAGFATCNPPTAAFTVSSASSKAPLTVQLDAGGSADLDGAIVQYDWTANGQTLVGQKTSTTFTAPGQYSLVLTVKDNDGFTATKRKTVTATTNCQKVRGVSERECESLLQLYQSTNGANWKRNDGWNLSNTPCDWAGVICGSKGGVIKLELSQNNLTGAIPDFSGLPKLEILYLYSNQLTGTIPDFSGLPKLQTLWLNDNQLMGAIPYFGWYLTNLRYLDLRNNQLCKNTYINYRRWPIKPIWDWSTQTTWQEQLSRFPACTVNK
jgi:Leucine-rich repeat (LRR) protein